MYANHGIAPLLALAMMSSTMTTTFGQFQDMRMTGNSISLRTGGKWVSLQAVGDNIVRVQAAPGPDAVTPTSFMVPHPPTAKAATGITGDGIALTLGAFSARINPAGDIAFLDKAGNTLLAEAPGTRRFEPVTVQGGETYHLRQQWRSQPDESLMGLGQHQAGLVNIKGYDLDLWQQNTEIVVPLLVSSKGYGILWDNNSYTKFGDPRDYTAIPADHLFSADGAPGGFTRTSFADAAMTTPGARRIEAEVAPSPIGRGRGNGRGNGAGEAAVRWEGELQADAEGVYKFRLIANGSYKLYIDNKLLLDHWKQGWLVATEPVNVTFAAGSRHKIRLDWGKEQGNAVSLTWKTPDGSPDDTSLWSNVGAGIDYYFIYGGAAPGALDRVLAGYRTLTGQATLMPRWAFGLWQSRQRYETQQASLDVVKGFRDRKIPFDNIVQDWMYWRQDDWGSHKFDPQRFPDPDQWVKDLHALHAHVMISVWGKFYPTTDNYQALADKGWMYPVYPHNDWVDRGYPYAFYDAFAPGARDLFWRQVNERLFSKGFDAWWMDATEPDLVQPSPATLEKQLAGMPKTAAGTGAAVQNAYPLLNSMAVYEGQRKAAPDQRVFILTRSGFGGQQRYAAASWSGDITSTWTAMKKQIAAGLGCSISGLPYWTMDCGGFSVPARFNSRNASAEAKDEWRELNARWFEFAAFVPLLRVHGESPYREMWEFGGERSEAYQAMLKFDRLRYRLLPYIYSLAGDVTQRGGTFMRPLAMDFPDDARARDLADQYLFGAAFLVSPITTYKTRSRQVYLPAGAWYDFWSGTPAAGGQSIDAPAPYDAMPLHIRAGSIIPLGPELQYTGEKSPDPLTLLVYAGADGQFSLYEDDGLTYGYEKGAFSRIQIAWNDAARTLTLASREGTFPGMLGERTIHIVLVSRDHPVPFSFDLPADKTVHYVGAPLELKL
jgi:alpha-D-xyloside xylohydrolase